MKKISLVAMLLALSLAFAGCKKADTYNYEAFGVKSTGAVIDISDKNGASATSTPGDILYLKLSSPAEKAKQWTAAAPTSSEVLMLQDHKVAGRDQETSKEFVDEWWLKVEQTGTFSLQFNYGVPGKKVEKTFAVEIVSQ